MRSSSARLGLVVIAALSLACERRVPIPVGNTPARDASALDVGVVGDAAPLPAADAGSAVDALAVDDAAPDGGATPAGDVGGGAGDDATVSDDATSDADVPSGDDAAIPDSGAPANPCAGGAGDDAARYVLILACLGDPASSEATRRAAIDAFVTAVEEHDGFPIQFGGDLVFVYVRSARWDAEDDNMAGEDFDPARRNEPITLAGDLNGWTASGPALTHAGLDLFHLRVPAPAAGTARSGYKLVARDGQGGAVFFSDPLSRRFDYDAFGRISLLRGGSDHGHLERLRSVHAARLGNDRPVYVWLPPGYEGSTGRYPVLYMHDGNNLFDLAQPNAAPVGSWEVDQVVEAELAAGRIVAPIVVGIPNNADRFSEYTPVADDLGSGPVGGDAADYADFIVSDLKPRIDARFRTRPERAATGVLGSSLGGLVSYAIGLAHPSVFRFVGGMSSTFGWGRLGANNPTVVESYAQTPNLGSRDQQFYLDSGGAPPNAGCTGLDDGSDNYCATVAMRDTLVTGGVATFPDDPNATPLTPAGIDIYHWHEAGASHSEGAWRARLFRPLRLFLRP